MRRLLILCPRFGPITAPDQHRVRMLLPFLAQAGWKATVLHVNADDIDMPADPSLRTAPDTTECVAVEAARWPRKLGIGSLALRSWSALRQAGNGILPSVDLVFVSTTEFLCMTHALYWKRSVGVPYVLDFQDPWFASSYQEPGIKPPGGRLKYATHQLLARYWEPRVVRNSAAIVTVSDRYTSGLSERYAVDSISTVPFGAPLHDMELAAQYRGPRHVKQTDSGRDTWTSIGRVSQGMHRTLRTLLQVLSKVDQPPELHFVGTSYSESGESPVQDIVVQTKTSVVIREHPGRVPYLESLKLMLEANLLLVIGSEDPSYVPSRLGAYLAAGRPVLGIVYADSSLWALLRKAGCGVVEIDEQGEASTAGREVVAQALTDPRSLMPGSNPVPSDSEMAETLIRIFDSVVINRA